MTNYIYIPIMTPEMAHVAGKWNRSRVTRGKQAYQIVSTSDTGLAKAIRRQFGSGTLENVNAGDKLCLLSHGIATPTSGGAVRIGNKRGGQLTHGFVGGSHVVGGQRKMYRVDELARAIEQEGLTKGFVDLRLFCCVAGMKASVNGQEIDPYAQRLKNALVGRGYNNITVTGYLGDLVVDYQSYLAPGTTFASSETITGVGLGVKIDGEVYTQDAKLHSVQF